MAMVRHFLEILSELNMILSRVIEKSVNSAFYVFKRYNESFVLY